MLAELALRLATPAARMTRKLGLVTESVALWSRGLRQRRAWAGHHARCRAVVAQAIAELPERRTAVILGSGLLRDIPLGLLCANFERVLLVDAVHLPQIRLRMRFRRNVTLLTRDLTGIMGWLAGEGDGRSDPLADLVADLEAGPRRLGQSAVAARLADRGLACRQPGPRGDAAARSAGTLHRLAHRRSRPLPRPRDPAERCRDDRARSLRRDRRPARSHAWRRTACAG